MSDGQALFLDRDGTLIVDRHFLADPAGVELISGTADALRHARELGYQLFLFTNQSGIGRGLLTHDDVVRVNARFEELLGLPRPVFGDVCIAPEVPGQPSLYRKPSPRFIQEMITKHHLDPARCWVVGDRADDLRAGLAAGIGAVLVLTGQTASAEEIPSELAGRVRVVADLAQFVASLR